MANNYTYLMAAVGTALHAWSQVENGMTQMFWNVSDIKDSHKSDAIFDAIISFETRIAVLDATVAMEAAMSDEEKLIWSKLSARLRKLYKKRHEVAHFSLADAEDILTGEKIAPFFTWGKHRQKATKYLSQAQLRERTHKFINASQAVNWFVDLMQHRKLPAGCLKPQIPEPDLIVRIRELIALTPEEQKHLLESEDE